MQSHCGHREHGISVKIKPIWEDHREKERERVEDGPKVKTNNLS